jgi:hypothetical protein
MTRNTTGDREEDKDGCVCKWPSGCGCGCSGVCCAYYDEDGNGCCMFNRGETRSGDPHLPRAMVG